MIAWIDGACEEQVERQLRSHIEACPSCAAFYDEQLALTRVFQKEDLQLDPPAWVWTRIQAELDAKTENRERSFWEDLARLLRPIAVRYAAAALVIFVLMSAAILRIGSSGRYDAAPLAELAAYQIEASGNPFDTTTVTADTANPFYDFNPGTENPFNLNGSSK